MSLRSFVRILCLTEGYTVNKIVSRILVPSQMELEKSFPIWFKYQIFESGGMKKIVFKIKHRITGEDQQKKIATARDICFYTLVNAGIKTDVLNSIFVRLDYEDVPLFLNKLNMTVAFIRENKEMIKNPERYLIAVMDKWFSEWESHYEEFEE